MCGRFVATKKPQELAEYFDVKDVRVEEKDPSFNVAPSDDVMVIAERGETRQLGVMHWGLVPFWAKDVSIGNRMINAKAETLTEKPAFRRAFEKHRCLIPADGFYEWKRETTRNAEGL